MKALIYRKNGGPEKDELVEIPKPTAANLKVGQVLIKVHAASLNPVDYKQRNGGIDSQLLKIKFPVIHGFDFAGVVEAKAEGVNHLKAGDQVFGMIPGISKGSVAEYMITDAKICAIMPDSCSFEEAACIPLVGITSILAYRECGLIENDPNVKPRVLILGGAGGVGTIAIQLAKYLYNASFIAVTASDEKFCKELGADMVINHRSDPKLTSLDAMEEKFDVLFDTVGTIKTGIRHLKPNGKCASIAAYVSGECLKDWITNAGNVEIIYGAKPVLTSDFGIGCINAIMGTSFFRRGLAKKGITYNHVIGRGDGQLMQILRKQMVNHQLRAVIERTFPLEEAKKAMETLEAGHVKGKLVITCV